MSRQHTGSSLKDVPPSVSGSASASVARLGLCATCNHAKTCSNCGTPEHPIFFCELFDDSVPVSASAPAAEVPKPKKPETFENAGEYKGLCTNCENRQSCTMAKQAGGVWHCEEYR